MTDSIANGESGASARAKLNTVLAGQFRVTPTYAGSEIVVDGDLLTDPTAIEVPWFLDTGSVYSTGQITSTYNGADLYPDFSVPITTVAGNTYLIVLHQSISGDASGIYFDSNTGYFTSTSELAAVTFVATFTGGDSLWIDFDQYNSGATRTVTLVSMRQVDPLENALSVYGIDGTELLGLGVDIRNVAVGRQALLSNTTGSDNVAVGPQALLSNTTGSDNVAVGLEALQSSTTGNNNVAVGPQALQSSTTSNNNVAVGLQALQSNTTGNNNVAVGLQALQSSTTGSDNIAVGLQALLSNTTGSDNVAVGLEALQSSTTGNNNVAVGLQALQSSTTGNENVAVGPAALLSNTTGSDNVVVGSAALLSNTTGNNNVAVGPQALQSSTTGNNNVAVGFNANVASGAIDNAIAIGFGVLASASNTAHIGNNSATDVYFGEGNAIVHALGDAIVFPDADPHVAGAAYWVAGVLTKSAG
jgi:carbonic anhydrase/acetyltransferase-like protein (isoleucine patch superfamily)